MKYKFCPYCGAKTTNRQKRKYCRKCQWVFYQNPAPCAGAIIEKGDSVLLGKRKHPPFRGYWDIIGGFLEPAETPLKGVLREVKEETGLAVKPVRLLGIFPDSYNRGKVRLYTLSTHYVCKIIKGKPEPKDDVAELKWFNKRKLPKKIAFTNCRKALNLWTKG